MKHPTLFAAAILAVLMPTIAQAQRLPNVIYVFSDQHRWQSMGHTTMPKLQTPTMDRMAAEGVSFDLCISNYPVCSPYRAMLMTGKWPYQTRVIDNSIPLNPNETTLGDAFQGAGYTTGYIGKWHLGGTTAAPFGFNKSLIWTGTNNHWDTGRFHTADGESHQPEGYNATLMTDQATDFIRDNEDRPFFLMLSLNPPHTDYRDAPQEMRDLYPPDSLPHRANFVDSSGTDGARGRFLWDDEADAYYRGYHAHVSAIDRELGRIRALVEELDLAEDTLIVYSSDHGVQLGSHNVGGKRQPYDESIRVPFLVWGKGIELNGARYGVPMGTIDIMPTLCGLAGIAPPSSCVGKNIAPLIQRGQGSGGGPQLIMHIAKENATRGNDHPAPLFRGIRTHQHTFALFPDGAQWLFDNQADPYQQTNLATNPDHNATRSELRRMLSRMLEEANDPYLKRRPKR